MTTVALTTTTIITSFITITAFATITIFTPTTIFTTTTIKVTQQQICTLSPSLFASLPPSTGSRSSLASSPAYTPPPDTTAVSQTVPQQAMPAGGTSSLGQTGTTTSAGTTEQTLTALNTTAEDVYDSIYTLNNGQPVGFVRQCTAGCDQQVDNSTETGCAEDEDQ
ncbi:uncharacterized protein C8A04DRAFT_31477 [Dichotomopilus funicola]|uniref:Uncharacterized protein n=1 Tax=Dichotomopilus funicola TaxID=1934379 RepID=A0AAN6ZKP8_9PEZI|nr:hypothetical protein C8A04DRAFT_31477 [Dichotomopilus funicola]